MVRESTTVRYCRWNRDRTIEWAMAGSQPSSPKMKNEKKPVDGTGASDTKEGTAVFQQLVREVGVRSSYSALTKPTTMTRRGSSR